MKIISSLFYYTQVFSYGSSHTLVCLVPFANYSHIIIKHIINSNSTENVFEVGSIKLINKKTNMSNGEMQDAYLEAAATRAPNGHSKKNENK